MASDGDRLPGVQRLSAFQAAVQQPAATESQADRSTSHLPHPGLGQTRGLQEPRARSIRVSPAVIRLVMLKMGLKVLLTLVSSIIRPPVRGGILVDPVLLGVGHAFAPRDSARGPGVVKGAAFRAVAEGFEPVLFL